MDKNILLDVHELRTCFKTRAGLVVAVNNISYSLAEGDTLGVVGESGCGKSVHALSILRLVPNPPGVIDHGEINFEGRDLLKLSADEMRDIRGGKIAMIFQDPMRSLNPMLTIGFQIMEAIMLHQRIDKRNARIQAARMLDMVEIPGAERRLDDYPHQFSGGMRQRAMIAIALSSNPKLLIADEATTALDVTVQAQIIDLIKRLKDQLGMSVIWITHDLGVVAGIANRINVMYAGHLVESGSVRDIFKNPQHPYTIGLLRCLPGAGSERKEGKLFSIPGFPPRMTEIDTCCPFSARCEFAKKQCFSFKPELREADHADHLVACFS